MNPVWTAETVRSCPAREFTHYHYICWQCGGLVCSKYSNGYTCEKCDCGASTGAAAKPSGHWMADFDPEFAATAHSPA